MAAINLCTKKQFVNIQDKSLYVTRVVRYSAISEKGLIEAASRNSGINRGLIQSVTDAINNEFKNFLLNGHSVKVPFIGSFRLSVQCKATSALTYTDEKTGKTCQYKTDDILKRLHIVYTPSSELRQLVSEVEISLSQEK